MSKTKCLKWQPVRNYWWHPNINGLWNMDDYGNLYRVRRWEVIGRLRWGIDL
jgi:hypothetical protein